MCWPGHESVREASANKGRGLLVVMSVLRRSVGQHARLQSYVGQRRSQTGCSCTTAEREQLAKAGNRMLMSPMAL